MNKKIISLSLISLLHIFISYSQETGSIFKDTFTPIGIQRDLSKYVLDMASYVTGGVFFNYPIDYFGTVPMVNVSLQINVPFSTDITYSAVIVLNNLLQTHICVSKFNSTTMTSSEADPGEVTVTVYAIGDGGLLFI